MNRLAIHLCLAAVLVWGAAPVQADFVIEDFDPPPSSSLFSSFGNEDIQPTGWQVTNTFSAGGTYSLRLYGNTWKLFDVSAAGLSLQIDTVWRLAAYIPSEATVQGFGLTDGVNTLRYELACYDSPRTGTEWVPTYAGSRSVSPQFGWFTLPVGRDWLDRYGGTSAAVTALLFFNDEDTMGGQIYLDEISDVTDSQPVAPLVDAGPDQAGSPGQLLSFSAAITDPDSASHAVTWDFGDGQRASGAAASHAFARPGLYRVLVQAVDIDGLRAVDSLAVTVGQPEERLVSILFGGDCMLGRRYEDANEDGIPGNSDGSLILPGDQGAGAAAIGASLRRLQTDHRVVNLETTLANTGTAHPEKTYVFRSRPDAVAGLTAAGIDLVSLANNHTLDYMDTALAQTFQVLAAPRSYSPYAAAAAIGSMGAGLDDGAAAASASLAADGVRAGLIGLCSVLGLPDNQQPFLDAGFDKAGAWDLEDFNVRRGLAETETTSDLSIAFFHCGEEYETQPSAWARAMSHAAIDAGADLVVCSHPHVLHGLELYQGVPIAYSLGNLIFEQKHALTKRSAMLRVLAGHQGVAQLGVVPVYIEDYVPRFVRGYVGEAITASVLWLSSSESGDVVPVGERAYVLLGHEDVQVETAQDTLPAPLAYVTSGVYASPILEVEHPWQVSTIDALAGAPATRSILLGQDILLFGGFEDDDLDADVDEGTGWELEDGVSETISDYEPYAGTRCLRIRRQSDQTTERCVESSERHPITRGGLYSLRGAMRLVNADQAKVQVRWHVYPYDYDHWNDYNQVLIGPLSGNQEWTRFEVFFRAPTSMDYAAVHMCASPPDMDTGYAYWDDVRLIEWTERSAVSLPLDLQAPNGVRYLALKASQSAPSASVTWTRARWTGADSDGDGLPDWIEDANGNGLVDQGETDPAQADSDGDGIEDGEEDAFGEDGYVTLGWKDDSDGDQWPDPTEIAAGTNPTDPASHPSGTPPTATPTPYSSPTPTPSAPPTSTPSATPTSTTTPTAGPGSPTPTPVPTGSGEVTLDLVLNQAVFHPGDLFDLRCRIENGGPQRLVDEYIILDVLGGYWFWPGWTIELDREQFMLPPGNLPEQAILTFEWPSGAGSLAGVAFWGALLDPETSTLVGTYDREEFGFEE